MAEHVVFLFDVDNTLIDNDRIIADMMHHLEQDIGAAPAKKYWEYFEAIRGEIKKQLRPYRSHMDPAVYEQTFENLLLKRLREQFGVPRLSLFYL